MAVEEDKVSLTDDQMAIYRTSAERRQQQKRDRLQQRQKLGLTIAQQASELLKRDFQAEKVVLFGSMRLLDRIHERSDVDLAVWGLNPQDYFQAVGQLLALHPNISVDLVEVETAPPRLRHEIETTGVIL
jgi:uncharacterized protein